VPHAIDLSSDLIKQTPAPSFSHQASHRDISPPSIAYTCTVSNTYKTKHRDANATHSVVPRVSRQRSLMSWAASRSLLVHSLVPCSRTLLLLSPLRLLAPRSSLSLPSPLGLDSRTVRCSSRVLCDGAASTIELRLVPLACKRGRGARGRQRALARRATCHCTDHRSCRPQCCQDKME